MGNKIGKEGVSKNLVHTEPCSNNKCTLGFYNKEYYFNCMAIASDKGFASCGEHVPEEGDRSILADPANKNAY